MEARKVEWTKASKTTLADLMRAMHPPEKHSYGLPHVQPPAKPKLTETEQEQKKEDPY